MGPHAGCCVPARSTHRVDEIGHVRSLGLMRILTSRHVVARGLVLDMSIRWTLLPNRWVKGR